jgi:hypothetical protein
MRSAAQTWDVGMVCSYDVRRRAPPAAGRDIAAVIQLCEQKMRPEAVARRRNHQRGCHPHHDDVLSVPWPRA